MQPNVPTPMVRVGPTKRPPRVRSNPTVSSVLGIWITLHKRPRPKPMDAIGKFRRRRDEPAAVAVHDHLDGSIHDRLDASGQRTSYRDGPMSVASLENPPAVAWSAK